MAGFALTINLSEEKQGLFCRVPLRIGEKGRKHSPTSRAIAGRIFGISYKKSSPSCWTSYDQVQEEFGICRATVAKSFGNLKQNEIIKEKARDREGTAYTYVGKSSARYDVVPLYLFTADVVVEGKRRRLTKAQVLVLSHLMTECKRPKNNNVYEGSIAQLARVLALSETTVKKALLVLMKARLIFRPEECKGKNGHKLTKFTVAKALFDYERKRRVRAAKKEKKRMEEQRIEALDAQSERDSYYLKLQERAQARADKYLRQVNAAVPQFIEISKELRAAQLAEVKAEVKKYITLPALQAQRRELEARRREIMKRYNILEERMKPEYYATCKRCFDKGTLPNGYGCTCYLRAKEGDV